MSYLVFGMLVIGFLFWLTERRACKRTKIDDTSEADNTETDYVPIKADIEKHNAQVQQQWTIAQQKAQQHISSILDRAYKDYVNRRIKENNYIYKTFTLHREEYGITYSDILTISQPFTYNIYTVECIYSDIFKEHYIQVTVNN